MLWWDFLLLGTIELQPTNSTQPFMLMGRVRQFTYTSTPPHMQAISGLKHGNKELAAIILFNGAR